MINLLSPDVPWLTFRQHDGHTTAGAVCDLVRPEWADLDAPRADFCGATYQLLIGLLQAKLVPDSRKDWLALYHIPPTPEALQAALADWLPAFALSPDSGPAFMQDLDPLASQEPISTLNLLIDQGSDSNSYFNKSTHWAGLCPRCTALALFTLQINAPSGGVGHRVSLRGGGPLTTLVLPSDPQATLWQRLWLNVIPRQDLPADAGDWHSPRPDAAILPWLGATRISDKTGVQTPPDAVHPLQAYWSMPRRIRLAPPHQDGGCCEICGQTDIPLFRQYRTRNYGTNYTDGWLHPLTPYTLDSKNEKPPLSVKGKKGNTQYRQWLALTLSDSSKQQQAAAVVSDFLRGKARRLKQPIARLWCFGFEMDNMKAKCWYDSQMPLLALADPEQEKAFAGAVQRLLQLASERAELLRKQVKAAMFRHPSEANAEPMVEQSFWQATEASFYQALDQLAQQPDPLPVYRHWMSITYQRSLQLFDQWVLNAPIEQMDDARVVKARHSLGKLLSAGKASKALYTIIDSHQESKHVNHPAG